jgi:hypothetical protein|tara:strand:+ start:101 stop:967 length:867 start_codon:yes stop_codon:yes gene_type:complete
MANEDKSNGFKGASGNEDLGKDKSEFRHLNTPVGTLNPFINSQTTNVPYSSKGYQSVLQQFNATVEKVGFVKKLPEKGPFLAVVIKVENNYIDPQESEENWAERAKSAADGESTPLFSIRARIPEFHSHIPMPLTFPNDLSDEEFNRQYDKLKKNKIDYCAKKEQVIIDMHPVFTCMSGLEKQTVPQIGSLVWVDFIQGPLGLGGVYIGPFGTTKVSARSRVLSSTLGAKPHQASEVLQESSGANAASGQTDSPTPSEDSQVAKPKPIKKETSATKQMVSFGNWEDVL